MSTESTQAPLQLTIATRESRLALWQAEHVKALLEAQGHSVTLLGMTTQGDQILDRSLSKVGGKGLFVKELEVALEEGRADIAVHSLKDVPMDLPAGFELACVMEREDPRDAFVSPNYESLEAIPQGGVVGTSSLRRTVLLRAARMTPNPMPSSRTTVRGATGWASNWSRLAWKCARLWRISDRRHAGRLHNRRLFAPWPASAICGSGAARRPSTICKPCCRNRIGARRPRWPRIRASRRGHARPATAPFSRPVLHCMM